MYVLFARIAVAILACPLPVVDGKAIKGPYLSVVMSNCSKPNNLLPIVDLPARRDKPGNEMVDYAICSRPMYDGPTTANVYEFIEFIEVCEPHFQ